MPERDAWRQWGVPLEPPQSLLHPPTGRPVDDNHRTMILDWAVNQYIANGWRVESRSPTQAVLVRGEQVNHVLHAVLTVFTCLLWGIVWLAVAAMSKVERVALTVDQGGHVQAVQGPG
ncbi:hypothetical protein [Streptomyces sp. NBC_01244]|uniref:hypothetical protein n=1 Tax=Streptomyces sp. NBC_01244 TaxID=2903797 RepID=UPI002E1299E0|nr:hypothetical protein OG247_06190 [Streptomyces sp. NBC_01244]